MTADAWVTVLLALAYVCQLYFAGTAHALGWRMDHDEATARQWRRLIAGAAAGFVALVLAYLAGAV